MPALTRRSFLAGSAAAASATLIPLGNSSALAAPGRLSDPFQLGVASGEPLPDGVVIWTRLAPDPLAADGSGGTPPHPFWVRWEVAEDERFRRVVRRGATQARPELAHSVHVEVEGLRPGREHFYRFKVGPELSPVGRTKTAPAAGAPVDRLRFAFASCQDYSSGFYPAYRDMASDDLDLVVHLGDYIYESADKGDLGRAEIPQKRQLETLSDYRIRHAQYKTDPQLQAAHGAFPWLVTFDDHEVENNWADEQDSAPPEAFLERRAAAFQAYYEHMPLRRLSRPQGPNMQIYRRIRYGDIAVFHILDTRQYRDDQAQCTEAQRVDGYCPAALDQGRTILGDAQERWLYRGLGTSTARWNAIANQTRLAPFDMNPGAGTKYLTDAWGEGYVAEREQLLGFIARQRPNNPVVITGDFHRNLASNLKADFDDPDSRTLATEYLGTSVSSFGAEPGFPTHVGPTPSNPYTVFYDDHRGYVRCELSPELWRTDYRVTNSISTPDAPLYTIASYVTENGNPGAQLDSKNLPRTGRSGRPDQWKPREMSVLGRG